MICWSCQSELRQSLAVRLDAKNTIPCCIECWEQIPAGQRLLIAAKFDSATEVKAALRVFRRAISRQTLDDDLPGWVAGRG